MLFGKKGKEVAPGWEFRPMGKFDITPTLGIIGEHDEDDASWAVKTYHESLEGHYVLTYKRKVAGVSGFSPAIGTDGTYWISWTYLTKEHQGAGMGHHLLGGVLEELQKIEARKVFVSTSDYSEGGEKLYEAAVRLYQSMGFQLESRIADYYDAGEAKLTYGLHLSGSPLGDRNSEDASERSQLGIELTGFTHLDETEEAFVIEWESRDAGQGNFSTEQLREFAEHAHREGARAIFVSFASDLAQVKEPLKASGFQEVGKMKDFWEDHLHDVQFRWQP